MSGHLSGVTVGAALAVTAAATSTAAGLALHHGTILLLLVAVLAATRWCGRAAGFVATVTGAAYAVMMLASGSAETLSTASDGIAVILLGALGAGIANWAAPVPPQREERSAGDPRRLKEEFLATVSHELRTPLNAILGWTELLRMPNAVPPQQVDRGLEVIERNARRQLALVEELLTAAEPGSSPQEWERLELRGLLQGLLTDLQPGAAAARVGLAVDGTGGATLPAGSEDPIWVRGDQARLRLALRHILDNAIKYTPAGGEVRTCLRQSGEQVLLFVSDTGRGIATGQVEHVFEPFRQLDNSAARPHGGLGLGLTIARRLVESHGGHVDLRSDTAAGGATVLVTLPASARVR